MARALGTSFTASMAVTMAPKSTLAVASSVEEASVLAASEAVLLAASEEALAEEEAAASQQGSKQSGCRQGRNQFFHNIGLLCWFGVQIYLFGPLGI